MIYIYNAIKKEEDIDEEHKHIDTFTLEFKEFGKYKISYNPNDTVSDLLNDISFFTRIPVNNIKIQVNKKEYSKSENKLKDIGISKNKLVSVAINYEIDLFDINVDLNGVIGKSGSKTMEVNPTTKISSIIRDSVGVDSSNCFAECDGVELSSYKSLIDYKIDSTKTIEINTLIPDE